MTPTQRSLAHLRKLGYTCAVVEHWNPFARVRQDLFGFVDILAFHPQRQEHLFIQTTTRDNLVARRNKIMASTLLPDILACYRVVIHAWATRRTKGASKVRVELVEEEIRI